MNFSDPFGLCAAADTGRAMTPAECEANADQCAKIDCNAVRIHEDDPDTATDAMRTDGKKNIYVGRQSADYEAAWFGEQLAHELTHIVQRKEMGAIAYFLALRYARLMNPDGIYTLSPTSSWEQFGIEQQGMIVEHCFGGNAAACRLSPYLPRR